MRSIPFVAALLLLFASPSPAPAKNDDDSPLNANTMRDLKMRGIGPALMSGRIADIVIHPERTSTWYVAVGSGGVWKTTNAGITWEAIFEREGSYSIGCITLDPNRPETVWVGTGENVGGRHVGYGDGVYRSLDGGASWTNMGLKESEHIGTILVDPRDSNVILVAAQGPLWSAGGDRGLYKTADGGTSWEKILGGGLYTGVNEVRRDPSDPDVLYASTHQKFRNVAALVNGGPESGIHKSTDGGATWRELVTGLPKDPTSEEDESDMGKIGLAISPQNPQVLYAAIEQAHRKGGFYRSSDGGETWEKRNDFVAGGTGPHYYQEIFASPHAFDRVYHMDVWTRVTDDGGTTFRKVPTEYKHPDNHALAFRADDPDYLLSGTDGGVYESFDLGEHWRFMANLPVTQYYKVAVDYDEPFYNVYGGTQDNNTQGGPSRTQNRNGILNRDWFITLGGDGHQPAVDPTNPDIVYSEWQVGNLCRFDRKSGEITYIQPQPAKGEEWDRFNWDSPIVISPHDPARLYFASQRVWKSDDRGDSWTAISGDLSRGLDRLRLPMMGRVQSYDAIWDLYAMSKYGTITSLSESPIEPGLLYAGTDDGLLHVSEDGGANWRRTEELSGVEDYFFVNDVKADLHDPNTAYAVVDHHKDGDFAPYVLKSTDRGRSWKSIVGDLPDRHVAWRIVQDHVDPDLLFVGTEFGAFFTIDGGRRWVKLAGAPNIPFRDLVIQKRENDLVGATFGRGFYVLDDYTALRDLTEAVLKQEAELFPVRDAWWYLERYPLGDKEKASQGDGYFTAPNPPFGAVFTYHLRDGLETQREMRREREREIAEKNGDNPYPGWDTILEELDEEEPAIVLTVRDAAGEIVRWIEGPVTKGFHRVAWDLRYPSPQPWEPPSEEPSWEEWSRGRLAEPGTYTVAMAKRIDGALDPLGRPQTFVVKPLTEKALPGVSPEELVAFTSQVDAMRRDLGAAKSSIEDTKKRIANMKEVLLRSTGTAELRDEAHRMAVQLEELKYRLSGHSHRSRANDPGPVSVERRLDVVVDGTLFSTYGPTPTHRKSFDIAREEFADVQAELDVMLGRTIPALEARLDAAGVPWTPGRGVKGTGAVSGN